MAHRDNASKFLSYALNTKEISVEEEKTEYITDLERQRDKISTPCAIIEAILASGSEDSALLWIADVLAGYRHLPRRLLADKTVVSMVEETSNSVADEKVNETDWIEALGDDRCLQIKPKQTAKKT